jgi:hypothetical protein
MKKNQKIKKIRAASAGTTAPPRIFFLPAPENGLFRGKIRFRFIPTFHPGIQSFLSVFLTETYVPVLKKSPEGPIRFPSGCSTHLTNFYYCIQRTGFRILQKLSFYLKKIPLKFFDPVFPHLDVLLLMAAFNFAFVKLNLHLNHAGENVQRLIARKAAFE